jgi:hypothetical protein
MSIIVGPFLQAEHNDNARSKPTDEGREWATDGIR